MNNRNPLFSGMDILDWIIIVAFVLLFGVAGYFLAKPWGAIPAVALAIFLAIRAKRNRDRLRSRRD